MKNKAPCQITHTRDVSARTQLSVLRAAEGVQVPFAVHHHAELSPTGHLHQGLAVVGNLEGREEEDDEEGL